MQTLSRVLTSVRPLMRPFSAAVEQVREHTFGKTTPYFPRKTPVDKYVAAGRSVFRVT